MRNNTYILYVKALLAALLLSPILLACSEDSDGPVVEEAKYATMVISLGSLDNSTPAYTRATVETGENDTDYERYIDDWWVVIMHEDTVDRVLSNTLGNTATALGGDDNHHGVEVELLIGETYQFYAFANLPETNADYLNGLEEGSAFDITQTVATINATTFDSRTEETDPYFPMSSYKTDDIEVQENVTVEIPLIRLLGKVTVTLTNSTNEDLTLKGLSLDKFRTTGSIYLLPYDEAEGKGTKNLLNDDMNDSYVPSFPTVSGETVQYTTKTLLSTTDKPVEIAANGDVSYQFYTNETDFDDAGLTWLQVTTKIDGRNDNPMDTEFSFIRRNDWLKIPLLLSDVSTTISFDMQHMPIGGLPATITIPEGLTIPEATFWTQDHGGDITITYTLNSISSLNNATIKHYGSGDSYEADDANPYTSAVLESNGDDLLINVRDNSVTGADPEKVYPWLDNNEKVFIVPTEDGTSGYFTVTAQELAKSTEARIRLTIVIEGTNTNNTVQTVVVPYTIIIKNKKEQGWEEGGN